MVNAGYEYILQWVIIKAIQAYNQFILFSELHLMSNDINAEDVYSAINKSKMK